MVEKNKFQIGGFQKLSLLDYPGKMAAIVFTRGCNFRCPFCHNYELVENINEISLTEPKEIMDYLIKRKNVLDGLTITGGEPTIQEGLEDFIREVKNQTNLAIKLDTNGTNPEKVKSLLDKKLVDYVAMDIKNDFENYWQPIGLKKMQENNLINKIKRSIEIIKSEAPDYEFRTTVIKTYHTKDNIQKILEIIGRDSKYYLQQFIISDNVPNKVLEGYTDEELKAMYTGLKESYPNIFLRGIKSGNL